MKQSLHIMLDIVYIENIGKELKPSCEKELVTEILCFATMHTSLETAIQILKIFNLNMVLKLLISPRFPQKVKSKPQSSINQINRVIEWLESI